MQSTKALLIGAGISALMTMGTSGVAGAQAADSGTSPATKTIKPHKRAPVVKKPSAQEQMAAQMDALRMQVETLQRRLDAQGAAEQQTKSTADQAVAQAAAANAQAATATAATQAIPVQVKTAVEAAKPKTDKIYYKGVTITLGGFAEF